MYVRRLYRYLVAMVGGDDGAGRRKVWMLEKIHRDEAAGGVGGGN